MTAHGKDSNLVRPPARIRRVLSRLAVASDEKRLWAAIRHEGALALDVATRPVRAWYWAVVRSSSAFDFRGGRHRYFYHGYNATWRNERAVEVAVVRDILGSYADKRVLEVGCVLPHYFSFPHEVVDKYEQRPGVINQDIVDYRPVKSYDLVISISTLEHVGFAETPQDPDKILRAVENMKRLLAPDGGMVVTVPLGYNASLDRLIAEGALPFTEVRFLKRMTASNRWQEVAVGDVRGVKYGEPFPFANAVAVCLVEPGHTKASA